MPIEVSPLPERDEPDPVAAARVVVGAEPPRRDVARASPRPAARRDVVEVTHAAPPAPHRPRSDAARCARSAPAACPTKAPGRWRRPASGSRRSRRHVRRLAGLDLDRVVELADAHRPRPRRTQQLGALGGRQVEQVLVEHVAAKLERRHRRAHVAPGLARLRVAAGLNRPRTSSAAPPWAGARARDAPRAPAGG